MNESSSHRPIISEAKKLEMQRRRHRFQRKRTTSSTSINGGGGLDSSNHSTYSSYSQSSVCSTASQAVSAASTRARQIARAKEKASRMKKHRNSGFISKQGYSSADPTSTKPLDSSRRNIDSSAKEYISKPRVVVSSLDASAITDKPNSSRVLMPKTREELSKEGLALIGKHQNLINSLKYEKEISILTKEMSSTESSPPENKAKPQKVLTPREQLDNFAIYGPTTVTKTIVDPEKENKVMFHKKKRDDDGGLFCTGCLFSKLML